MNKVGTKRYFKENDDTVDLSIVIKTSRGNLLRIALVVDGLYWIRKKMDDDSFEDMFTCVTKEDFLKFRKTNDKNRGLGGSTLRRNKKRNSKRRKQSRKR